MSASDPWINESIFLTVLPTPTNDHVYVIFVTHKALPFDNNPGLNSTLPVQLYAYNTELV